MLFTMLAPHSPLDIDSTDLQQIRHEALSTVEQQLPNVTQGCRDLLVKMLHPNQHERISIADIKQDLWFLQ